MNAKLKITLMGIASVFLLITGFFMLMNADRTETIKTALAEQTIRFSTVTCQGTLDQRCVITGLNKEGTTKTVNEIIIRTEDNITQVIQSLIW
jgi:predicted DNA-binding protein with PD1-like motif